MELKPTLSKREAMQLSNVLDQTIFHDLPKLEGRKKLNDTQKHLAQIAIEQLRQKSDSDTVIFEAEPEVMAATLATARAALEDPRGVMFGLITHDIDMDDSPTHYDERGDAFRSLAVTADFVQAVQPWER